MKHLGKRLLGLTLSILMVVSVLPVNVFAWSSKSHANSANIILLEEERSAKQNVGQANVTVRAPYDGDETSDTYSYKMPQEFQDAIFSYPDAFRAGSLGPDFYPDIIAGQMIIHPYEEGMSSGEWITVLCDSVNMLPKESEVRKEALAFTLGCMLHYCGDLFGHDFINTFSGGSFPAVMDVLAEVVNFDYSGKNLNNVLSHMSSESYMDKQMNWSFYDSINYLEVDAPDRFVADTWVGNGSLYSGHTKLYDEYSELPPHFEYLIDWRTELYNEANEWRDNPDPTISAAATKYLDRWVEDQDRAIYALVETFDRIAARLVEEKDPDMITVVKEEIKAWGLEYGIYITGVPDWMIDFPMAIDDFLEMLNLDLIDLDELLECLIEEAILNYLGIPDEEEIKEKVLNRLSDPSKQLDSSYNPYMQGENNFAEFKTYMDKYAAEQKLLSGNSLSDIISGNDSGALDEVIDSDFEAFYNTMAMFKLILMGPDNFKTFVKELSGKTPTVYNSQKTTYVTATAVELEISTADLVNAGTDDDIYAAIVKTYDNGQKGRVQYKLLDKSYYNDFEAGDKDKYFVEFSEPVRLDRLEVSIIQKDNGTAGDFWKCDDITITPMHVGVALTDPISVGGNHDMDSERMWELEFQKALNAKNNKDTKTQNVTTLKVRIKTGSGTYPGTDSDVYLEAFNGSTNEVWKSVLLDKPGYNDFEKNDDDTYIVPVTRYNQTTKKTEGIPLDQLKFRIKNSGSDEWYLYEMWVTPYNGNIQLTDTIHLVPDNHLEKEYVEYDIESLVKDSNYRKIGSAPMLSYKTSLDDDLIKYVKSIDGAAQWVDNDNPLWKDATIRKEVFFKVFKGFRPEIKYTGTTTAEYNKPLDMTFTFDAFWNGVRRERRNNVWDIAKMAAVEGTAKIYFINSKGTYVTSTQATLSGEKVVLSNYTDAKLLPGTYDIKVVYSANASNPMYADTEKIFSKALTIGGVGAAITTITVNDVTTPVVGVLPVNVATSGVTGSGVTKVAWQCYDSSKAEWKVLPEGTAFEKGKRYKVTIRLAAKNGYVFTDKASGMTVFINGNKANVETNGYSSSEFYVNMEYVPAEPTVFTVQPKGGEITTGESLTVSWATSFTPVKLALSREDMTRAQALDAAATSHKFTTGHEKAYKIVAYYSDSEYVQSEPFYITEKKPEINPEDCEFTLQPKDAEIADGESVTVTWKTSFTPVKQALLREDMTRTQALGATATSHSFSATHEKAYTILAYYTDSEYITSDPFYINEKVIEEIRSSFTDVAETNWFYDDVLFAVKLGLVNGKSETEYKPDDNLTYAEAVKLAACMHQLYTKGEITLKNGDPWYQSYVDYCVENGIIDKEYNYSDKATRSGYMTIFAKALPDEALKEINNVPDNSIPDVPTMRAYAPGVYKLYRAGILQGSDDAHSCKPLDNIKRSEVAAILARMMDESKRVKFSLGEEEPEEVTPLEISVQPEDATAKAGETVNLTVEVKGGKAPYTYQWQAPMPTKYVNLSNSETVSGADTATLSITKTTANSGDFRCVITDADGQSVTSEAAKVTFTEEAKALAIKTQPVKPTVYAGGTATLKVEVEGGKAPYTYQWQKTVTAAKSVTSALKDGEKIQGATTDTLKITADTAGTTYNISCKITDADGTFVVTETVTVYFNEKTYGGKDKFQQVEGGEELKNEEFLMYVEDVYYITGRQATVAQGYVAKGKLNVGDSIIIVSSDGTMTKATVEDIEMFRKSLDEAERGDTIGLQFNAEIDKNAVKRGDSIVSAQTNYMVSDTLVGTLTLITEEEGGRRTAISDGYSPQFYCNGTDITGVISGIGTMNPGTTKENVTVTFKNFTGVFYIGQEITVREGGRTYGTFTVKEKR